MKSSASIFPVHQMRRFMSSFAARLSLAGRTSMREKVMKVGSVIYEADDGSR